MIALSAAMTPLLWQPLTHVWDRSLSDRRLRAVLLFLSGYFVVRMMAIAVLAFCSIALRIATGGALAAFAAALGMALLWQGTSAKARFLKRCHAFRPLPAFGLAADLGSFRFGAAVSRPCIVACWALMLLPLTSTVAHVPLMVATAAAMLSERYAQPAPGGRRWPLIFSGLAVVTAGATLLAK